MVPKFNYKPNDYFILSMVTAVICGIFSPISLVCSLPALLFSSKVYMQLYNLTWHSSPDIITHSLCIPVVMINRHANSDPREPFAIIGNSKKLFGYSGL